MKQKRNVFKKTINHIILNTFPLKSNQNTSKPNKTESLPQCILSLHEKRAQINSGFYSVWDS